MFDKSQLLKLEFNSKQDYKTTFLKMMNPLLPIYRDSKKGRLELNGSGAVYSKDISYIESFLRPLWGVGPYLINDNHPELLEYYLEGIKEGSSPESPDYWGETKDYDQRLVEMASLANAILICKEKFWDTLEKKEQDNLYEWLMQINQCEIPKSNWVFFRILVNLAMEKCDREWDGDRVEKDFQIIENSYIGNGWYFDENPTQIDYYISFAIHYYSLIYYKFMKDTDIERSQLFKNRAIQFAQNFKYWFDNKGEAIPFGRSLTYRFAQSAFWCALVYADIEALPWSEVKSLISQNIKNWMEKDIFDRTGILTIGYHYPNLIMAEGYNAPGSPYWGMKVFLLLAVPESHPFWTTEPTRISYNQQQLALPEARMLVSQTEKQVQAYVTGQIEEKQAHVDSKYSKLVYSTVFGNSISKGSIYYKQGGFDNCLALSEEKTYYRSKLKTENFMINNDFVMSEWNPWSDVKIMTSVIPIKDWHLRIHDIETNRTLHAIEGGFSVPEESNIGEVRTKTGVVLESNIGTSSIFDIFGYNDFGVQLTEPNTNLYFPRTVYPYLETTLKIGKSRLISLVGGSVSKDREIPSITLDKNSVHIYYRGESKIVNLLEVATDEN